MISVIDASPWTAQDQTGGGALHEVILNGKPVLFAFGNTTAKGEGTEPGVFKIYRSDDFGYQWQVAASCNLGAGTIMFNPATALDESGDTTLIHVLGWMNHPTETYRYNLVKMVFDPEAGTLSRPLVVVEGSKLTSAYGFVVTAGGTRIISVATLDPLGPPEIPQNYSLVVIELNRLEQIESISPPVNLLPGGVWPSPYNAKLKGGMALSTSFLLEADGRVELYTVFHSKLIDNTRPNEAVLKVQTRNSPGKWSEPEEAFKIKDARYTDDKLTVVAHKQRRFLTLPYYQATQKGLTQSCLFMFGFPDPNGFHWRSTGLMADDAGSWSEPLPQVDEEGNIHLIALRHTRPAPNAPYPKNGFLRVFQVNESSLNMTPIEGAFNQLTFRWLRGRASACPVASHWMVIGQRGSDADATAGGLPMFVSKYNLPPIASVKPAKAVMRRGKPQEFDATGTVDPDLHTLKFEWSVSPKVKDVTLTPNADGNKATLIIPKSIGPAAATLEVQVKVTETDSDELFSDTAKALASVEDNFPPVISFESNPILAKRNETRKVSATIKDADADEFRVEWKQVAGSPIVIEDHTTLTPTLRLFKMLPSGDIVKCHLTVTDDINPPVEALLTVVVPAISNAVLDTRLLSRSFFMNDMLKRNIAERHTYGRWGSVDTSAISSNFRSFKISNSREGQSRYLYISPTSVVCMSQWGHEPSRFFRKCVTPPDSVIADAVHVETDTTFVLLEDGRILCFATTGPAGVTDYPDAVIIPAQGESYRTIDAGIINNNRRVLVLSGPRGVLLIQILSKELAMSGQLRLSTDTNLLYGSDDVTFVRFSNLESLTAGKLLIGTRSDYDPASPDTQRNYETLVDLKYRRIIDTWDSTELKSRRIWTGEILEEDEGGYLGRPTPPTLVSADPIQGNVVLSWEQSRPDLIDGFRVFIKEDGEEDWKPWNIIDPGTLTDFRFVGLPKGNFVLRMNAFNKDGISTWSNVMTHLAASEGWVDPGWVSPVWVRHKGDEQWIIEKS